MIKQLTLGLALLLVSLGLQAQQTIRFTAEDGVEVTADHYVISTQKPYLILLHQAGSSRGEYREIAPKLANLGFNCLSIDLRVGDEINFVKNQTAIDAISKGKSVSMVDARKDIKAAIEFVAARSQLPIILLGSSYSASLGLMEATRNFKVKAVVAFSPMEFSDQDLSVKDSIHNIYVPILALSTKLEYPEMSNLLRDVRKKHLTLFKPSLGEGAHGAQTLWASNPNHKEYWMVLTQFFSQLNLKK
ncbi:MAG: dienelactone hydrolase family protein [Bacteroidales bacterium]|nr:dienelactone hydrolase family protein [Bacteroidales bacterium]